MKLYSYSHDKTDQKYIINIHFISFNGFTGTKKILLLIKSVEKYKLIKEISEQYDPISSRGVYYSYISFPTEYNLYITLYANQNQYNKIIDKLKTYIKLPNLN